MNKLDSCLKINAIFIDVINIITDAEFHISTKNNLS